MKYDFTSIIDRKGYDAIAVDLPENYLGNYAAVKREEGFDVIPMWVADMNFPVVPTIQKAVIDRVKHPAFGYFSPRDEYFELIRKWQETRNHVSGLENRHIKIPHCRIRQSGEQLSVGKQWTNNKIHDHICQNIKNRACRANDKHKPADG